jgi:hypothetical protein
VQRLLTYATQFLMNLGAVMPERLAASGGRTFHSEHPLPEIRNKTLRTAGVVLVKINGRSPVKRVL